MSQIEQIEQSIADLEAHADPALKQAARELIDGVLEFHRVALGRLLSALARQIAGFPAAVEAASEENPLVAHLLMLHDLHPTDLKQRILVALEHARPYLPVPGTTVKLVETSPHRVEVELAVPGDNPGTFIATQRMLEDFLFTAVPDVAVVECRAAISPENPQTIQLPILNSPW